MCTCMLFVVCVLLAMLLGDFNIVSNILTYILLIHLEIDQVKLVTYSELLSFSLLKRCGLGSVYHVE